MLIFSNRRLIYNLLKLYEKLLLHISGLKFRGIKDNQNTRNYNCNVVSNLFVTFAENKFIILKLNTQYATTPSIFNIVDFC